MTFYCAKQPKSYYGKDFVAIFSYAIISKVKLSIFELMFSYSTFAPSNSPCVHTCWAISFSLCPKKSL